MHLLHVWGIAWHSRRCSGGNCRLHLFLCSCCGSGQKIRLPDCGDKTFLEACFRYLAQSSRPPDVIFKGSKNRPPAKCGHWLKRKTPPKRGFPSFQTILFRYFQRDGHSQGQVDRCPDGFYALNTIGPNVPSKVCMQRTALCNCRCFPHSFPLHNSPI